MQVVDVDNVLKQYYWPGHWNDVKKLCNMCNTYPLQTAFPMQTVAVNFVVYRRHQSIICMAWWPGIDYFTWYMEVQWNL